MSKNTPEKLYRPAGPPPPEFLNTPRGHKKSSQWVLRHDRSPNPHTVPLRDKAFLRRAKKQAARQQAIHAKLDRRASGQPAPAAALQSLVMHFMPL